MTNQKYFYGFDRQGNTWATCGQPNKITGRMNCWGRTVVFSTKKALIDWADGDIYRDTPSTKRNLRGYHLGDSLIQFDEWLDQVSEDLCQYPEDVA